MRLPKAKSHKLTSTKETDKEKLMEELLSQKFSGYIRLTVEREGKLEDGYVILKEGKPVSSAYEGSSTLLSEDAFKAVEQAWGFEGVLDIYEFTPFQLQISLEENPEALLPADWTSPYSLKHKGPEEEGASCDTHIEQVDPKIVTKNILKKRDERLALLKKFGIREPEDEFVGALIRAFKLPSERELNNKSREIKVELLNRLKKSLKCEELDIYISPSKVHDKIEINIDVYVSPYSKELEDEVKTTIETTLREHISFPYQQGVTINTTH